MDIYTIYPQCGEFKKITRENFESDTKKGYPWYRKTGNHQSHYAICPSCNNPIEIVRLYPKTIDSNKPYGRHTKHSISDLAEYDRAKLSTCPLYRPITFNKNNKKHDIDNESFNIIKLLARDFYKIALFASS